LFYLNSFFQLMSSVSKSDVVCQVEELQDCAE
jgi:hypothetical protein